MAATDYLEQRIIDFVLKGNAEFSFTPPTTVYVALFTTATADDGSGTEVSGANYARQSVAFSAMTGVTNGVTSNSAEVAFPTAGAGGWGTITHAAVFDALSGGNMLYHGALAVSKTVNENDTFKIAAGSFALTVS